MPSLKGITFFILVFLASVSWASEGKDYISQETIDTTIQNAYFGFLSAAKGAGSSVNQMEAIKKAKTVAAKLKKVAENDPNKRYILWRVGELEQQIFLEEEEVLLKQMYQRQKAVNMLVLKFNSETGKSRPNFANLVAIQHRMAELDPGKGNELANLITERDRNISREVSWSIERAFIDGDFEKAEKEFSYITKNKRHLFISGKKYASFQKNIRDKKNAEYMLKNMDSYVAKIKNVVNENQLLEAKRHIQIFRREFEGAKNYLPSHKVTSFSSQAMNLKNIVIAKEDSLVAFNLKILKFQGSDDAIDYMDQVLRKCGVSNSKITLVDQAIMADKSGPVRDDNSAVNNDLLALTSHSESSAFGFGDINARLQEKKDSIKAYEEEQKLLAKKEYERTHKVEIKAKKKAEKKLAKLKVKAKKYVLDVYDLLEQNKILEAREIFMQNSVSIRKYGGGDTFDMLEMTIEGAYDDFMNAKNEPRNKPAIATALASTSSVDVSAYEAADKAAEQAQDSTMNLIMKIYSLLESDPLSANSLFSTNYGLLKSNSSPDVFKVLETTLRAAK